MYEAHADPYCYPGTTVLKNRLGLRSQAALDASRDIDGYGPGTIQFKSPADRIDACR